MSATPARRPALRFRPVISRRLALHDAAVFVAALKASRRFVVLETASTISFTFYKKPTRRSKSAGVSIRDTAS